MTERRDRAQADNLLLSIITAYFPEDFSLVSSLALGFRKSGVVDCDVTALSTKELNGPGSYYNPNYQWARLKFATAEDKLVFDRSCRDLYEYRAELDRGGFRAKEKKKLLAQRIETIVTPPNIEDTS